MDLKTTAKKTSVSIRLDEPTVIRIDAFVATKKSFQSAKERPYSRAKGLRDLFAYGIQNIKSIPECHSGNKSHQVKILLSEDQIDQISKVMRPTDSVGSIVRCAILTSLDTRDALWAQWLPF